MFRPTIALHLEVLDRASGHDTRGDLGHRDACGLADERDGARGTRVHLEHVHHPLAHCILDVDESHHLQGQREAARVSHERLQLQRGHCIRGKDAATVAGVDTRLLDMLHHAADEDILAVTNRVHIEFECILKKPVDQDRVIGGDKHCLRHVLPESVIPIADLHRPPAQHIGGTNENGITDPCRNNERLFQSGRCSVVGTWDLQIIQQFSEPFPVFGKIDPFRGCPENPYAVCLKRLCELQRRLPAKAHNHPYGLFLFADVQDIFEGQRFEIELIGGIVIGRDSLRIAVHHDGPEALFRQSHDPVHAAIVEFNSLTDAVRSAAEDNDLLLRGGFRLVLPLVRRVVVGGIRLEFGRTGIDRLVHGNDTHRLAPGPHGHLVGFHKMGKLAVGEPVLFRLEQESVVKRPALSDLLFQIDDLPDVVEEPWIDRRHTVEFVDREAELKSVPEREDRVGLGTLEARPHLFAPFRPPGGGQCRGVEFILPIRTEPSASLFKRAQGLLKRFLKGAAERHGFTDRFHLDAKRGIHPFEFFKIPSGDLHHAVINRRFEAGGGQFCNVIGNFVERVPHGELCSDLGNRKAGGLGCQGGRPRDSRVHFDDKAASTPRVDGKLDVGSAGLHADGTDDAERIVAHPLVLLVRQRLRRRHGNRIPRVYSHRVEVFDRTDDHDVVFDVAHHFQLEFLPADDRFLEEHLMDRARFKSMRQRIIEFLRRARDAAAGPAESERGTDDDRISDRFNKLFPFLQRADESAAGSLKARGVHGGFEQLPVFRLPYCLQLRPDQLDAVLLKHAALRQGHGGIQRGLSPHGRQERIGMFALDDLFDKIRGNGFDVRPIRKIRIGHDRRRVTVDEDGAVPFFAEDFACLGTRVVEFAGLTDDNGPGSDDEDGMNISALRHYARSLLSSSPNIRILPQENKTGPSPFVGKGGPFS